MCVCVCELGLTSYDSRLVVNNTLKPTLVWNWCRNANLVPTSLLADDIATAPSGPVKCDTG